MTSGPPRHEEHPPRWAEALLRGVLSPRDRDTVSGDLLEEYREAVLPASGAFRAGLWYVRQVLSLLTLRGLCRFAAQSLRPSGRRASLFWTAGACCAGFTVFALLARNNFGPPRLRPALVVMVTAALGVTSLTALRSVADVAFIWRAGRRWGALFAAVIALRIVFDGVVPFDVEAGFLAGHDGTRGLALGLAIVAVFLAAGFRSAWRTGRVRTGTLAAMAASAVGSVITVAAVNLVFNPFFKIHTPGTPAQVFDIQNGGAIRIPFVLLIISTVLGTIGGMFGSGLCGILRRQTGGSS